MLSQHHYMQNYRRTIILLSIDFICNIKCLHIPPLGITMLKPFIIKPWQSSPGFIQNQVKFALHKNSGKSLK